MADKNAPGVEPKGRAAAAGGHHLSVADIRASRPGFLTWSSLAKVTRRLASMVALAALDLCGLVLGLYAALVVRELYYGRTPPLWDVLWKAEKARLPFLVLITLLVFAQNR